MLSPQYLEQLPEPLIALWQQVEDDILRDIARRIQKMGTITETAAYQAWRLEQTKLLHTDIVKLISKYSGKSETAIRKMLVEAGTQTLQTEDAIHAAAGVTLPEPNKSQNLQNLLNAGYRQTTGTWKNLTATTANTVSRQFEDALDRAWLQVSSGAFDYQTAIRRAIHDLAEHMDGVTYPSGHRDSLEVAVRRATLTGVNQTCGKLQLERAQEAGCEFVEVTAHVGARDTGSGPANHASWQGKVYHVGGPVWYEGEYYKGFEETTGYGTGPGLCGWNCRHNFFPFWPGISSRVYTDEQLQALCAKDIEYKGKKYSRYEINQMQRARERQVRKWKKTYLMEKEAGLDTTQSALRLKNARKALSDFADATGGRVDSSRTAVNNFGHSPASKATWEARKAEEKPDTPSEEEYTQVSIADISSNTGHAENKRVSRPEGSKTWNDKAGTEPWDAKQKTALYQEEFHTTGQKYETGKIYNAQGICVLSKDGGQEAVSFSQAEIKLMKGCTLTHNHPNSSCFSYEDINMLRIGKLTEIRATTKTGVYRLQPPKIWPKELGSLDKIISVYYDIDNQYSNQFFVQVINGEISFAEADILSQEMVVRKLCETYGFHFRFDSWNDLLGGD